MRNTRLTIALIASLALIASACAGESDVQPESGSAAEVGTESTVAVASPDTTAGTPESPDDQGAATGFPPGGDGTVVIEGETFEAEWVGNCEIDELFNPSPDDLDLSASLGGLDALFLEISFREVSGVPAEDSYLYTQFQPELQMLADSGNYESFESTGDYVTGPDGTWYVDDIGNLPMWLALGSAGPNNDVEPLAEPPMVIDGDRISGAVTLEGASGSIDVSFDLTFLTDAIDCSL